MAGERVRVDPRVAGQLVRAGEALEATGEVALVGLLARVCSDVAGLVLEPVERLLAERTLVRPGVRRGAGGGGVGVDVDVVCSRHLVCAAGVGCCGERGGDGTLKDETQRNETKRRTVLMLTATGAAGCCLSLAGMLKRPQTQQRASVQNHQSISCLLQSAQPHTSETSFPSPPSCRSRLLAPAASPRFFPWRAQREKEKEKDGAGGESRSRDVT